MNVWSSQESAKEEIAKTHLGAMPVLVVLVINLMSLDRLVLVSYLLLIFFNKPFKYRLCLLQTGSRSCDRAPEMNRVSIRCRCNSYVFFQTSMNVVFPHTSVALEDA